MKLTKYKLRRYVVSFPQSPIPFSERVYYGHYISTITGVVTIMRRLNEAEGDAEGNFYVVAVVPQSALIEAFEAEEGE